MKNTFKTIIIEDDFSSAESLSIMLKENFPNVIILGIAKSLKEARALIDMTKPDLLFIDIELPDGKAFELLENSDDIKYGIIFTTSFNEYAVRAFEFSAIHYLLKPIEVIDLVKAVNRFFKSNLRDSIEEKLMVLKESINEEPKKIMLPSLEGYNLYNILDIVRCEADTSYTIIYFSNGERVIVSKQLKNFERLLSGHGFARIHSKFLVNMRFIKNYRRSKNAEITLTDSCILPVSQTYKGLFDERMKQFAKML